METAEEHSCSLGILAGVSMLQERRASNDQHHKIIISNGVQNKTFQVSAEKSFDAFLKEVKADFKDLTNEFSLVDGDHRKVDEEIFQTIAADTTQTWLIKPNNEHLVLEKPQYELLKYDVHPNALTQSGDYHFSCCYQAYCEFIDNAIQATKENVERKVDLHIYLNKKISAIVDSGVGMSSQGMKAFASYFLTQKDRGIDYNVSNTYGFVDGMISKFGVGATQAGFYLGDTIKVVTRTKDSPFVTEFSISKEKLLERARKNKPVFQDLKCIRSPGDTSTLADNEKVLIDLVKSEVTHDQFTMIFIKEMHQKHIEYLSKDNGADLAESLAHVYHYYLHGVGGSQKLLEFENAVGLADFKQCTNKNVDISIKFHKGNVLAQTSRLCDVTTDLQSQYQNKAKSVFPFSLNLQLQDANVVQTVQGCLLYFANESGEETIPLLNSKDTSDSEPMFECFWQGRLAPLSFVNRLEFCAKPEQRPRKQKDMLPDICFRRIRGLLFFNYLTPVSNNKLKILLDTRRDLSDALSDASSSRKLPLYFRKWLEKCHRDYDREITFSEPLMSSQQPTNGDIYYQHVKIVTGARKAEIYSTGESMKLDFRPCIYGRIKYFVKKSKANEVGSVVFTRLPEEVYGDGTDERLILRLCGKPSDELLEKVFTADKLLLPKYIKVFEEGDRDNEVPSMLSFDTGETMKAKTRFWVVVYNGENAPITEVAGQRKLAVKVDLTDRSSIINTIPMERKFGFKPFYFDRVGEFKMKFSVLLGNVPCNLEKYINIVMKANIAEILNLHENSPEEVELGVPNISFTLSFHDVYENSTCRFRDGKDHVKLLCTCEDLVIKGVAPSYKPSSDGKLTVSGLSIEPNIHKISLTRDYEFWVVADGIGDIMFPIRLLTGCVEKCKTTRLETKEFDNFNNFPEFEVKLLDKWNQSAMVRDRSIRVALISEAFNKSPMISAISDSKARFNVTPIKILNLAKTVTKTVKVALVKTDLRKNKVLLQKILKDLHEFNITVSPGKVCQKIQVVQTTNDTTNTTDYLHIITEAGTVVSNLKVIGYNQKGELLTDEDFLAQEPVVTTTWAEVVSANLPALPDCHVTNMAQVNVQNVQSFCTCNGFLVRNEAKIRINVCAGMATRWSLVKMNASVRSGVEQDLSNAVKILSHDKYRNPTTPKDIFPQITVEHSGKSQSVEYFGTLVQQKAEFIFTVSSMLIGHVGEVTLRVDDNKKILMSDSTRIQLDTGRPSKLQVTCDSFEEMKTSDYPCIKMFAHSSIPSAFTCAITDDYGNPSPTRTNIQLSWAPSTAGRTLLEKTNASGEVVFAAKSITCEMESGDAQIKISASSMKTIQPSYFNISIQPCNKVSQVQVYIDDSSMHLTATSTFPTLKITYHTADDVSTPNFKANVRIRLTNPTKKSSDITRFYSFTESVDGRRELLCKVNEETERFQTAGDCYIHCIYTERREDFIEISGKTPIKSNVVKLVVHPADAVRLLSTLNKDIVLFASLNGDAFARSLLPIRQHTRGASPSVHITSVDEFNNQTSLSVDINVSVEAVDRRQVGINVVLPQLEKSCRVIQLKEGSALLPRIALCEKQGSRMGFYYLVFADAQGQLQPLKIKFSFSTNEEYKKLTQELTPLNSELNSYRQNFRSKQENCANIRRKLRSSLDNLNKYFTEALPEICDIDVEILKLRNVNSEYELRQKHIRHCRKNVNYPSANVRQYIKGLVCELAHVTNVQHCLILSWYAQSKMHVCLCETREQQRKVYELGCAAYSEDLLVAYYKPGYQINLKDHLPIDLPPVPKNFTSAVHYAVNLLEFKEHTSHLRASLFWSVFGRTIVVSDLDHAQRLRESLVRSKKSCPAILTLDGCLLAADGLLDPNRRCPRELNQLKYSFGELPITERLSYRNLQADIRCLEDFRSLTFDTNIATQEMRECEKQLKGKEAAIVPRVLDLELKRERLKRKAEELKNLSSPTKKQKNLKQ